MYIDCHGEGKSGLVPIVCTYAKNSDKIIQYMHPTHVVQQLGLTELMCGMRTCIWIQASRARFSTSMAAVCIRNLCRICYRKTDATHYTVIWC